MTDRDSFLATLAGPDPDSIDALEDLELELTADGRPRSTLLNVVKILTCDPYWAGRLTLNGFTELHEHAGEPFTDDTATEIALELEARYGLLASRDRAIDAARHVANQNPHHPIKARLNGLAWDGQPRISGFLPGYFLADNTKLIESIGRCWLISAVARVFEPGCKVDTTLILAGPQGTLKSTALRVLALDPNWFSDSAIDVRNKDSVQGLEGVWIKEFAELEGLRARDAQSVKAYLSTQVDHFRRSYGRHHVRRPRQNVFVGTTNELTFLADVTGSRRFWPVVVAKDGRPIDLAAIKRDRDQLWAEAVAAYRSGEPWWLPADLSKLLAEHSQAFETSDPWFDLIADHLASHLFAQSTGDLLAVVEMPKDRQTKSAELRMSAIMRSIGWERRRSTIGGDRRWRWWPPTHH